MDKYLINEMRGAIFCDPDFVGNFLTPDASHMPMLERALRECPNDVKRTLRDSITTERGLYRPVLDVLNSIKGIVDSIRELHDLGTLGSDFIDHHASSFAGSYPDIDCIKPDLVMFEPGAATWETLMIPVEVKAKHTYPKAGMKQLARYARTVFAHQIHRRYVYGMVICRWDAMFVRFDRSGILHSKPIDMREKPKEFQRAFAGLMMLDRDGFGYDTAFSTERTTKGQIEYYIDLPAGAVPSGDGGAEQAQPASVSHSDDCIDGTSSGPTPRPLPTRRFKVMERLCHRKCIRGRATIVLRLQEVRRCSGESTREPGPGPVTRQRTKELQENKDEPGWKLVDGGREYVLKLMWRDPHKHPEGEVLKRLVNAYGVVQYLYHSDVLKGAGCHETGARSCGTCHDATPARAVEQASNLSDLDIEVPDEKEGEEPQYVDVDTDHYTEKLYPYRTARIYTWILVASVGKLLWTAENAREMLEAILDAILGYWHVVNRGILHRDISDGNVLIRQPGSDLNTHRQQEIVQDEPLTSTAKDPLMKSKQLLQETLASLSSEPRGFLSDYDLFATHSGMEVEFFGELAKRTNGGSDSQTTSAKDATGMGPESKRRKHSPTTTPSNYVTGKSQERDQSSGVNQHAAIISPSKAYKPIDFRTGTPTFMSSRVLAIRPGQPYEHHFMDDLQSFFWLIFWCAVQHIDSGPDGSGRPTEDAVDLLDQLDPANSKLATLGMLKESILRRCAKCTIQVSLEACKNSWAKDPAVVRVIQKLGTYFEDISDPISKYTPEIEFPTVIGIILDALQSKAHPNPEATSPAA